MTHKLTLAHPRYLQLKSCLKILAQVRGRVLDAGCGSGALAKEIKRFRPDLEITGLDVDARAVRLAGNDSRQVKFIKGSLYHLPFPDNYFSAVFSTHVLEHLSRPAAALTEISRVVKPGGRVLIVTPLEGHWSSIHCLFYRLPAYRRLRQKYLGHTQRFRLGEVLELMSQAGLAVDHYCWSGFIFAQLVNFFYYPLAAWWGLSPDCLTENDLLARQHTGYGRWGRRLKQWLSLLMNLETAAISFLPQETIYIFAVKPMLY